MRLKNKVAIIMGGASGIGQATALLFGEEGAKVVVADLNAEGAYKTATQVREKGGAAIFIQADIAKESDAKKIVEEAVRNHARVDILVNNAAAFVLKGLEATVEEWQHSLGKSAMRLPS